MDTQATDVFSHHAAALDRAIQDHQAGRLAVAEATYRRILAENPGQPDAIHLLGMLACDRGNASLGLQLTDEAIAVDANRAAFHNTRARALKDLGDLPAARQAYETAWSLLPGSGEIANNMGCLLRDQGRIDDAVEWLSRANMLAPATSAITCNLAEALAEKKAWARSVAMFEHALHQAPNSADAHTRFAQVLVKLGNLDAAAKHYRSVINLNPQDAASHNNLGVVLQELGRPEPAAQCFHRALQCNPRYADALYNLGCLLLLDGKQDEARRYHDFALAADPLHGKALWARCMVELPVLYDTPEQVATQRLRYEQQLSALVAKTADPDVATALAAAIGASQPFFLPYQGACDRAPQMLYGGLVVGLLSSAHAGTLERPHPGEQIRLGIVSGYFCEHTIWRLMLKGWLSQIDSGRFQIHAYHTGRTQDDQTQVARSLCARFTAGDADDIHTAIRNDRPHVLLYPELGMDAQAFRLAGQRLAPLQCVAWGQPETSGLPTIDLFLSSELMEPPDAESQYSERLVRLPNLGIYYTPDERLPETSTRADLGVRDTATVFWCGQALYKYHPAYDEVLVRIAAAAGDCQFVFIGFARSAPITQQFRNRLTRAFALAGMDADRYCVFLAPMTQERFLGSVAVADIVLDSLGWSGGKSTLDALAVSPVIVTHPGPLMRGRHTAAILTRIGITETIAETVDDYVAIAVRLARNPAEQATLRARTAAGRSRAMADVAPIRAMEAAMIEALET